MKTYRYFFFAFCAIAAVSCSKANEYSVVSENSGQGEFSASLETNGSSLETSGTRTTLSEGQNVLWAENDAINVFAGSDVKRYALATESAGSANGTFRGDPVSADVYYALYPYQAGASIDQGVISFEIPAKQDAVAGSFDGKAAAAVAKSATSSLAFKNVGSLLEFEITRDDITSVTLSSTCHEPLAGKVKVAFDGNGFPVVSEVTEPEDTITIALPSGVKYFAKGKYYAVVLPGTFEKSFTATFTSLEDYSFDAECKAYPGTARRVGTKSYDLARNIVVPLGQVDKDLAWYYRKIGLGVQNESTYNQFIDFQTGMTHNAVNAYLYCDVLDMGNWYTASNTAPGQGFGLLSVKGSGACPDVYNDTNLKAAYGEGNYDPDNDPVKKWPTTLLTRFRYTTDKDDAWFESFTTTDQLFADELIVPAWGNADKATAKDPRIVTANINANKTKYILFKTNTSASDQQYDRFGIIKVSSVNGKAGERLLTMDYVIGKRSEDWE